VNPLLAYSTHALQFVVPSSASPGNAALRRPTKVVCRARVAVCRCQAAATVGRENGCGRRLNTDPSGPVEFGSIWPGIGVVRPGLDPRLISSACVGSRVVARGARYRGLMCDGCSLTLEVKSGVIPWGEGPCLGV